MSTGVNGQWSRLRAYPYTGTARKWGTGINPIHAFYGSPPLRTYGRNNQMPEIHPPAEASPGYIETDPPWGYDQNDIAGLDVFADDEEAIRGVQYVQDDRPDLDEGTTVSRATIPRDSARPWGSSGGFKNILRSIRTGPGNINTVPTPYSYQIPTETVNEGWLNKPASGMGDGEIADSEPAADSQVFIQTSDVQRYKSQDNGRAVLRDTDYERTPIASRIAPMKLKVYSGEERHYDMFPYQIDQMPRAFWNRTAGTGRPEEMAPNEQYVIRAIQRTVPPDPSMGPEDTDIGDGGYTDEDQGYY